MAASDRRQRTTWLVLGVAMLAASANAGAVPTERHPTHVTAGTGEVTSSTQVPAPGARVRGLQVGKRNAAKLVEAARAACPVARRLLEEIERTDLVVLVEVRDRVLNRTGHLTFVTASHGTRWLRITIDAGNHESQQAAWLAHELQHAVEVARAPDVVDMEGLRRLFARIGTDRGDGQFETDAAVAVGKRALLEAYAANTRRQAP